MTLELVASRGQRAAAVEISCFMMNSSLSRRPVNSFHYDKWDWWSSMQRESSAFFLMLLSCSLIVRLSTLCCCYSLDWWIPSIYRCHLQQCSECNGECNERFHMFYIFLGASQQSWKRVTRFSNKMVNDVVAHCPWQLLWSSLVIMSKEIRVSIRVAAAQQCVANLNVIVSFPTPEINFMSDKETHEHSFFIHFRLPFHLTSPAIAFLHPLSSHSWTAELSRRCDKWSRQFSHIHRFQTQRLNPECEWSERSKVYF